MSPLLATALFAIITLGLFVLDREKQQRASPAVWIPVLWLGLSGSRMISQWLGGPGQAMSVDQALEGNALDRNILTALIVLGICVLIKRQATVSSILGSNIPILLFIIYCGVSVLWSDYPDVAFKRWTKIVGDVVMVLVLVTDANPVMALRRLLARLGFLLIPVSVLFIKYYPALGQVYSGMEGHVKYTGVTRDKNMLGVICLIAGLGCVWRFISALRDGGSARRPAPLLAQMALVTMVMWLFVVANSMTALACFLLATGLMCVVSIPAVSRRRVLVHLLVTAILGVVITALFFDVGSDLVETMGRNQGLTGRTGLWKDVLSINPNPIIGSGFESFWSGDRLETLWSIYWWHPNEAHNGYIEVFLNLGIIGVSLLALMIIFGYTKAVRALQSDPQTAALKLAFLVVGLAYSFTEAGFRVMHPIWICFVLGATAVPAQPQAVPIKNAEVKPRRLVYSGARRIPALPPPPRVASGDSVGRSKAAHRFYR